MYRRKELLRPKTKVAVALHRVDGPVLEGSLSVAGDERILDVMNSGNPFFPLEVSGGRVLLVNKNSIAEVEPFDAEWMQAT